MTDPYTMEMRLCDDDGMVSHEPMNDGPTVEPDYLSRLNTLRRLSGHAPYDGQPFQCTGSAHLAGEHIRCTSPAHSRSDTSLLSCGGITVV